MGSYLRDSLGFRRPPALPPATWTDEGSTNRFGPIGSPLLWLGVAVLVTVSGAIRTNVGKNAPKGAYVLTVEITLRHGMLDKFLELWTPLADYCRANEPNTLTYEMAQSDTLPNVILILERYKSVADLRDVHWSSPVYLSFQKKLQAADIVLDMKKATYTESGRGFVLR